MNKVKVGWGDDEYGQGPSGAAVRTKEMVVVHEWNFRQMNPQWQMLLETSGYKCCVAIPLIIDGKVDSVLSLYHDDRRELTEEELQLLNELSEDVTFGIIKLRGLEAWREADVELEASKKRFEDLFLGFIEGVVLHEMVYDENHRPIDYRILDVNPAYEHILGIPREKAVGKLASEVYKPGEPPFLDQYTKVVQSGHSMSFDSFLPIMNMHFAISVFPQGKDLFASIFMDISDQKTSEYNLKYANNQLMLLNGISRHDMSNNLVTLSGYTDLLIKGPVSEKQSEMLLKMRHIINNIRSQLDFMKQYQNIGIHLPHWQNLNELVEAAEK